MPPTGGMASVTTIGLAQPRSARRSMAGATCTPSTIIPNQACSDFERGRNRAGLAAIERPHGIEQMRKAGKARRHGFFCLRIGRHRVAKRNAHTCSRERSDKFQRDPFRRQCDEHRPRRGAVRSFRSSCEGWRSARGSWHAGLFQREKRPFEMDPEDAGFHANETFHRTAGRRHLFRAVADESGGGTSCRIFGCAAAIERMASGVGSSLNNMSPPPLTWISIKPGVSHAFAAKSTQEVVLDSSERGTTAAIVSPSITTALSLRSATPSKMRRAATA